MIGVLVSDIADPAVAEFIRGAESAAAEANYTMLLSRGKAAEQGQTEALERILGNVDGVVLANPRIAESVVTAIGDRWPLVVLDRVSAGVPSILTNHSQGARLAAEHLSGLGHQSISYVAGPGKSWADLSRLDRIEFGGQAVESARVSRPEERIWDRHDVGSPMNTNSTQ
jgi:LacI family transcriptional regulator